MEKILNKPGPGPRPKKHYNHKRGKYFEPFMLEEKKGGIEPDYNPFKVDFSDDSDQAEDQPQD